MDFAHTLHSSGLGIAVRTESTAGWMAVARALLSRAFLKIMGLLFFVLTAVGFFAWALEHKRNPEQFGKSFGDGVFSGIWWAMVTLTTVGYGDIAPKTRGGRLLGLAWMVTGLVAISFFTASITSALTVGQLSQRIQSADDLAGKKIGSLDGSTSADWLRRRRLAYTTATTLDEALTRLEKGTVDAVVYDRPLLGWTINEHHRGRLQVLSLTLERQDYAFALPTASPLREPLDAALLRRISAPDWPERLFRYLGQMAH